MSCAGVLDSRFLHDNHRRQLFWDHSREKVIRNIISTTSQHHFLRQTYQIIIANHLSESTAPKKILSHRSPGISKRSAPSTARLLTPRFSSNGRRASRSEASKRSKAKTEVRASENQWPVMARYGPKVGKSSFIFEQLNGTYGNE